MSQPNEPHQHTAPPQRSPWWLWVVVGLVAVILLTILVVILLWRCTTSKGEKYITLDPLWIYNNWATLHRTLRVYIMFSKCILLICSFNKDNTSNKVSSFITWVRLKQCIIILHSQIHAAAAVPGEYSIDLCPFILIDHFCVYFPQRTVLRLIHTYSRVKPFLTL